MWEFDPATQPPEEEVFTVEKEDITEDESLQNESIGDEDDSSPSEVIVSVGSKDINEEAAAAHRVLVYEVCLDIASLVEGTEDTMVAPVHIQDVRNKWNHKEVQPSIHVPRYSSAAYLFDQMLQKGVFSSFRLMIMDVGYWCFLWYGDGLNRLKSLPNFRDPLLMFVRMGVQWFSRPESLSEVTDTIYVTDFLYYTLNVVALDDYGISYTRNFIVCPSSVCYLSGSYSIMQGTSHLCSLVTSNSYRWVALPMEKSVVYGLASSSAVECLRTVKCLRNFINIFPMIDHHVTEVQGTGEGSITLLVNNINYLIYAQKFASNRILIKYNSKTGFPYTLMLNYDLFANIQAGPYYSVEFTSHGQGKGIMLWQPLLKSSAEIATIDDQMQIRGSTFVTHWSHTPSYTVSNVISSNGLFEIMVDRGSSQKSVRDTDGYLLWDDMLCYIAGDTSSLYSANVWWFKCVGLPKKYYTDCKGLQVRIISTDNDSAKDKYTPDARSTVAAPVGDNVVLSFVHFLLLKINICILGHFFFSWYYMGSSSSLFLT